MIRIVIENTVLFLLPTIVYVAYVYLKSRLAGDTGTRVLDEAPLVWLVAIGAALVIGTLIIYGMGPGGRPGQTYQPPVFRDGKIEPGTLK
jgi:Family of unknown function (DUF6111)